MQQEKRKFEEDKENRLEKRELNKARKAEEKDLNKIRKAQEKEAKKLARDLKGAEQTQNRARNGKKQDTTPDSQSPCEL